MSEEKVYDFLSDNEILQRITQLCEERGWSLYKLAEEANITTSTLTNLYARNNMPTIPTIHKLCSAFNISMSQFFETNGESYTNLSDEEQFLLDSWNELPNADKRIVQAYLDGLLKRKGQQT